MAKEKIARRPIPVAKTAPDQGLTDLQVQQRLAAGWGNLAPKSAGKTEKEIVLSQCFTFFNIVFVVMAVFLALSGSSVKNMTFMLVVVINTVIGILQQIRAKRAVEKLALVAEAQVQTVRNGRLTELPSHSLVRDDVIQLSAGDQVCADGILLQGRLLVNESLITGEDRPVTKEPGDSLLSGSFLVSGTGRIRLTAVGCDAFANKLALEAKKNPQAAKSGMMKALDQLIRFMGFALIPVGLALFYQQFMTLQRGLQVSAEATVAALVGMIPEGLYLLTSVAMAASALKLSQKQVLVQDMNCIETLARVDVLCVDKTGTITEPKMEVSQVEPLDPDADLSALLGAFYAGSPENETGRAIQESYPRDPGWVCTREIPFTSQNKWAAREFAGHGAFVIGAPQLLLGSAFPEVARQAQRWAALGYRVLLAASGDFPENTVLSKEKLQPLALICLNNRIRPEARDTFSYFREQGVAIKVISGDDPATVSHIALLAGIENAQAYVDAATLSEADLPQAAQRYTVFGRVTPEQKKGLIQALKAQGHTVAMTGDGVNDVLAMKEAHCGIAMASGAQAASQVAKLVLLENNFAVMPDIVAEGRRVINNIQRAAALFLVKNIFSFFLSWISVFSSLPYPLMPLHLTVVSAMTIGVPSFFLAMEPNYARVSGSFLKGALLRAFPGGLTNIFAVLAAMLVLPRFGLTAGETSAVCTALLSVVGLLVLLQISAPMGTWRKIVWGAMAALLALCFTVIPGFLELKITSSTALLLLGILAAAAVGVFFLLQLLFRLGEKAWSRRKKTAS